MIVYPGAGKSRADTAEDTSKFDYHLVAALGIHWAHAVSIRLVLESRSGLVSSFLLKPMLHLMQEIQQDKSSFLFSSFLRGILDWSR